MIRAMSYRLERAHPERSEEVPLG